LRGLWSEATLGELARLWYAINADLPVPYERRRPILQEVFWRLISGNFRIKVAGARVFIAAAGANMREEQAEALAARRSDT
jgi:hypothetical protein